MLKLLLTLLILNSAGSWAESTRILRPKKLIQNDPQVKRNPASVKRKPTTEENLDNPVRIDFSASTPLGIENLYDKRFLTYGPIFILSIPVYHFDKNQLLGLQLGLQMTLSSLAISQPLTNFLHSYIYFPLYAYYQHPLDDQWMFEIFAGLHFLPFSISTRNSSDGGFQLQSDLSMFQINGGIAINYYFADAWYAKLSGSYQYLAIGVGVDL